MAKEQLPLTFLGVESWNWTNWNSSWANGYGKSVLFVSKNVLTKYTGPEEKYVIVMIVKAGDDNINPVRFDS